MRQKYYLRNEGLLLSKHEPYQWAAGQIFAPGELSYHNGVTYLCKLAHVADSAHEPGIGASWQSAFDLLAVGAQGIQGPKGDPGGEIGNWSINETPSGTVNGTNVTFTLAHTPVGQIMLYLNGQYMTAGAGEDYTISGSTITMAAAPIVGDKIRANYPY